MDLKNNLKANVLSAKWNIGLNTFFILFSLVCLVPILLVIIVSFSDELVVAGNGYSFLPEKLSLEAYKFVLFSGKAILRAYGVTIFATVVGTIGSVSIVSSFAYPLSRKDFRYRRQFTFFVFFTILFGGGMVPWYLVCTQVLHLKNHVWALIIPSLMNSFNVIIMRTFFQTSIPDSVIESARIDGAGELRTFTAIVLPMSKAGLATIGLFTSLGYWNDFYLPLMLIDNNKWINLQYALFKIQSSIKYLADMAATSGDAMASLAKMPSETAMMAMCVITIGPIVLVYPFLQKYFVKGLVIGSIKG